MKLHFHMERRRSDLPMGMGNICNFRYCVFKGCRATIKKYDPNVVKQQKASVEALYKELSGEFTQTY